MKKTLLVLASLLMTMGAFAEEVVFDFVNNGLSMFPGITLGSTQDGQDVSTLTHDGDITEDKTATIDGVSMTVSPATGDNANRIWTVKSSGATSLRLYNGTMTFTAPKNIKSIIFTDDSKWTDPTASTGSVSSKTWTGDASTVVLTFAKQCRIKTIKVVYGEGGSEPTPDTKVNYRKVNEVSEGYFLIAANADGVMKVAQTNTKNYGYLYVVDATDSNSQIALEEGNEFKFTAVDGGYTIQQADGRYLYQKGTFNSFNFSDSRIDGDVFTVTPNADGTFKITNVAMQKYMQYSTQYSSYGSYSTESGIMPSLYIKESSDGISNPTVVSLDVNAPIYNLAGQRVSKDAKGILIQNGKKFVK